jgi:hypothetical protein
MTHKKEREQFFVEQLRCLVTGFPNGLLIPSIPVEEPPDFRVDLGTGILGIEVTEFPDQSRKAMESEWESVLREAESLAATRVPPLDVAVHFNATARVNKANRREIAEALVSAVSSRLPAPSEQLRVVNTWRGPLPESVHSIHVYRSERGTDHLWSVLDGGMGKTECSSEIQSAVSRKERRLSQCLEKCDRCWLLIVASGSEPSSFFEPDACTRAMVYVSGFERVFFLNSFSKRHFELLLCSH